MLFPAIEGIIELKCTSYSLYVTDKDTWSRRLLPTHIEIDMMLSTIYPVFCLAPVLCSCIVSNDNVLNWAYDPINTLADAIST